jgi:hypothetical protein
MRPLLLTLLVVLAALSAAPSDVAAVEGCRTGDSAICASDPNCHWDYQRRGCYEGPPAFQDPCAAHSAQGTCDTNKTFGCKWNAEEKLCKSAK